MHKKRFWKLYWYRAQTNKYTLIWSNACKKIYLNIKYHCPKTMSASLNLLVNLKGGKKPSVHQYESSEGVALTPKFNPDAFRVDCYNFWKYRHMAQDCPEPRKEEGKSSG